MCSPTGPSTEPPVKRFSKSFTQQEPIPEAAIDAAVGVMRSGRLHRYNVVAGEPGEVAELESEFARYLGLPYCLACASGGYALQLALRASGVEAGTRVLCNSFTLAPVPGALQSVGAIPDWVETSPALTIDLDHLEERASDSSARHLLLSYMRGHMPDMDRLLEICNAHDLCLERQEKWHFRPRRLFQYAELQAHQLR
jgi:dTDP-4-amino-4,6-dideoxygalactose transaminase